MLDLIRHDSLLELHMALPPVNALGPPLVRRLREAVETASAQGASAIALSGSPGMFSAGLDVPALLQLDRDAMRVFWNDFFGLCGAIARSPIPIAAAITGHSPAGGAVLAIMSDYRVMARGAFKIGLNEVQVGLSVPAPIQAALRRLIGAYRAERLLVSGAMIDPDQALALGLVDELIEPDLVVARTLAWLGDLVKLPPHSMHATRHLARADLANVFAEPDKLPVEDFLDSWFAPEAQSVLKALVARLKSKS
jgi:enoyl-CoA hydratase/carnithine racemase